MSELCPCRGCTNAYKQGREDAAKAVENLYNILTWDEIVSAARGDGEQG